MPEMKHILRQFLQREASPFIQFIKYALAGGLATVVDIAVFYLLAWLVIPALTPDDGFARIFSLNIAPIDDATRSWHYVVDRVITFLFSNLTAYVANILWVFEPGRHSRWMELSLFYAVSGASFLIGTALGWVLIHVFGLTTSMTYVVNMVVSLMINYAGRKFLIFKG